MRTGERIEYCEDLDMFILSIGAWQLWFETYDEAFDYWEWYQYKLNIRVKKKSRFIYERGTIHNYYPLFL